MKEKLSLVIGVAVGRHGAAMYYCGECGGYASLHTTNSGCPLCKKITSTLTLEVNELAKHYLETRGFEKNKFYNQKQ
jgi:hypothetical protein